MELRSDTDNIKLWNIELDQDGLSDSSYEQAISLVDASSQARVRGFYHRADAWRTLISRILPRMLLYSLGVPPSALNTALSVTDAGKPYIVPGTISPPLAINMTHDSSLIILAHSHIHPSSPSSQASYGPAYRLGVDIMRPHLPPRETATSFIRTFSDQLSPSERSELITHPPSDNNQLLRMFFRIWTVKEAYTKALGLGLGFDFSRLSLQPVHAQPEDGTHTVLYEDGRPVKGWEISTFGLEVSGEAYVGATARFVGVHEHEDGHEDDQARVRHRELCEGSHAETGAGDSLGVTRTLASVFVKEAISALANNATESV